MFISLTVLSDEVSRPRVHTTNMEERKIERHRERERESDTEREIQHP